MLEDHNPYRAPTLAAEPSSRPATSRYATWLVTRIVLWSGLTAITGFLSLAVLSILTVTGSMNDAIGWLVVSIFPVLMGMALMMLVRDRHLLRSAIASARESQGMVDIEMGYFDPKLGLIHPHPRFARVIFFGGLAVMMVAIDIFVVATFILIQPAEFMGIVIFALFMLLPLYLLGTLISTARIEIKRLLLPFDDEHH